MCRIYSGWAAKSANIYGVQTAGRGFYFPHITHWSTLSGKMRINEGFFFGGGFRLKIRWNLKRGYKPGNFIAVAVFVAKI